MTDDRTTITLTIAEVQTMLGTKEIELYRLRTVFEAALAERDAEIRALKRALDRTAQNGAALEPPA
jgi:hypothetical protein